MTASVDVSRPQSSAVDAGCPGTPDAGAGTPPQDGAGPATDVRWLDATEARTWRTYLEVTRRISELVHRQLMSDNRISSADYDILARLSEAPGRTLRMSELAERAVNSRSRLTHAVGRMEAEGLVRRTPCPDDGRGVLCTLTDEGFAVIDAAAPGHVAEVRRIMFDPLTDAEVHDLGAVLGRMLEALRADDAPRGTDLPLEGPGDDRGCGVV